MPYNWSTVWGDLLFPFEQSGGSLLSRLSSTVPIHLLFPFTVSLHFHFQLHLETLIWGHSLKNNWLSFLFSGKVTPQMSSMLGPKNEALWLELVGVWCCHWVATPSSYCPKLVSGPEPDSQASSHHGTTSLLVFFSPRTKGIIQNK